jgi:hypothetical protein
MDAIWSYWSAPSAPSHTARWKDLFHQLLAWAISLSAPGVVGYRKVLYTDSAGARLLAERLRLPLDEMHCTLDEIPSSLRRFWVLGKLHAYKQHRDPFVHLDSDVFLWKSLPDRLHRASIFSQNPERFSPESQDYQPAAIIEFLDRLSVAIPKTLRWYTAVGGNEAYCCGILGGSRVDLLNQYAAEAIDLIEGHSSAFAQLPRDLEPNVVLEQYMLSAFCCYQVAVERNTTLRVDHLFESERTSRTAEVSSSLGYTHLIGPAKLDDRILAKVNRYAEANLPEYHHRAKRTAREYSSS